MGLAVEEKSRACNNLVMWVGCREGHMAGCMEGCVGHVGQLHRGSCEANGRALGFMWVCCREGHVEGCIEVNAGRSRRGSCIGLFRESCDRHGMVSMVTICAGIFQHDAPWAVTGEYHFLVLFLLLAVLVYACSLATISLLMLHSE